jgi:hypothetical protein
MHDSKCDRAHVYIELSNCACFRKAGCIKPDVHYGTTIQGGGQLSLAPTAEAASVEEALIYLKKRRMR